MKNKTHYISTSKCSKKALYFKQSASTDLRQRSPKRFRKCQLEATRLKRDFTKTRVYRRVKRQNRAVFEASGHLRSLIASVGCLEQEEGALRAKLSRTSTHQRIWCHSNGDEYYICTQDFSRGN